METVTCQYTGIQFQAASRRSKNHPLVSDLLGEAAKDRNNPGAYRQVIAAFDEAQRTGMTNIDDVIAFARDAMTNGAVVARRRREDAVRQQREADEVRHQRKAQNEHLRANGYRWSKEFANSDEYEEGEASLWTLWSPDQRVVTVAQALDEIERGVEVVLAELEVQNKAEAIRKESVEFEQKIVHNAYEQVKAAAKAMPETEPFDDSEFEVQVEKSVGWLKWSVRFGELNGIRAAVVVQPSSDDVSRGAWFYCAAPEAAGLMRKAQPQSQPGALEDTLAKFFGG